MNAASNNTRLDSGHDFARRQLNAVAAAVDRLSVHNGEALGLYQALAEADLTAPELADRTGLQETYVRYWLQQQVMTGFVQCVPGEVPNRYRLLPELCKGLFDMPRPLVSHRMLYV